MSGPHSLSFSTARSLATANDRDQGTTQDITAYTAAPSPARRAPILNAKLSKQIQKYTNGFGEIEVKPKHVPALPAFPCQEMCASIKGSFLEAARDGLVDQVFYRHVQGKAGVENFPAAMPILGGNKRRLNNVANNAGAFLDDNVKGDNPTGLTGAALKELDHSDRGLEAGARMLRSAGYNTDWLDGKIQERTDSSMNMISHFIGHFGGIPVMVDGRMGLLVPQDMHFGAAEAAAEGAAAAAEASR